MQKQSASFNGDDAWQAFAGATTVEASYAGWLPVLCSLIPRIHAALLLLEDADGSFAPVSVWPLQSDLQHLAPVAQESLVQRKGVVNREAGRLPCLAYPLIADGHLHGAVVIELQAVTDSEMSHAMRITHWGAGWLVDLFNSRQLHQAKTRLDQSAFLFDAVLAGLSDTDCQQASLAIVNKLAEHFGCHLVQLGLEKSMTIEIIAVSHSAWFDKKSKQINLAAQAMNESYDQNACILWPEQDNSPLLINDAHHRYALATGCAAVCSLPLVSGVQVIGVIMMERDTSFNADELDFLETLALTLAPILALKKDSEQSLLAHSRRVWTYWLSRLTDTSHPGMKLAGVALSIFLLLTAIVPADYRVSAPSVIEGEIQRAAVAPFEGYIRAAPVRAGDIVRKGQLLFQLEDKDLNLERNRWEAQLQVALAKGREAMAKADRVNLRMAWAQADQARAQLNLTMGRLNRTSATAPFDAVIVKGDLSQKLGSPVKQGDVQFELAPLDAWRLILKVDERDIAHIREGQPGELVLTSLPGQVLPFNVMKITPVALAEEGRNYFRVEAKLLGEIQGLRPNMEGVGKITAEDKPLLWIWTHRLMDWVRLAWWTYLP